MPPIDVKGLLQRHQSLKQKRQYWFPLYQALAQFVMLRKQYFTTEGMGGPFLLNTVFDATALHSAHMMASSLLGQIFPNPAESVEFLPQVAQEDEVFSDAFDMMNTVNEVLPANISTAESGTMAAFHEGLVDAAVFGIGAVSVIETESFRTPILVKSIDAKVMSIDENDAGAVDTVYLEKEMTIGRLVQRYGYDNVSDVSKTFYNKGELDKKVKVVHCIEPRRERNPLKLGNGDAPFASIHIEMDKQHVLQESGFEEMPIIVFRFWKNVGEVQGRSPAMDALPDIRAVNKLVEMFERAGEMSLDPPRMISSEDVLGAGKIPWGPGVSIPIHQSGRMGSDRAPIEPIFTVQSPIWAKERIIDLRENIKEYFMNDVLSDLNNSSRQTLGEAHIRNELRMFKAGPMLIRLLLELISPFLDRCFNILLSRGYFGVVAGSVQDLLMQMNGIRPKYLSEDFINSRVNGLKGYRLNFICPAARLMKLEESQGVDEFTNYVAMAAQLRPDAADNVNFDEAVRAKQKLSGATQKLIYPPGAVAQQRRARAQAQAQQQELLAAQAQAGAFKDAASGVKGLSDAAAAE